MGHTVKRLYIEFANQHIGIVIPDIIEGLSIDYCLIKHCPWYIVHVLSQNGGLYEYKLDPKKLEIQSPAFILKYITALASKFFFEEGIEHKKLFDYVLDLNSFDAWI